MLGWNMGVSNFILGGINGYSGGNDKRARKNPPSNFVSRSIIRVEWILSTPIVFAIIIHHEHDLPLKDVVVHKPTADARQVFVRLHLLQLSAK